MPPGFKADEALVALAEKCMQAEENIQVVKGMIATGDSFMSDPNRVATIRDKFENLYAVEMEARLLHKYATNMKFRLLSFAHFLILLVKNQMFHLISFRSSASSFYKLYRKSVRRVKVM